MYIEELRVGMSAEVRKTVTQKDIQAFADLSGDHNPVHLNAEFAVNTPFKGVVAHGMLSASFLSTIFGTMLPGPGTIYLGQTLRFLAPVRPGDEVRAVAAIKEIVPEKRKVVCQTTCYVGTTAVIDGEATLMAPSRAPKA